MGTLDAFKLKGWTQEYLAANVQCSRPKVCHFLLVSHARKIYFKNFAVSWV